MILRIEYVTGEVPNQVVMQTGSSKMVNFTVVLSARKDGEAMVVARGMALPKETYVNGKTVMGWFDRLERYKKEFQDEAVQVTHIETEEGKGYIEFDSTPLVKEPSPSAN